MEVGEGVTREGGRGGGGGGEGGGGVCIHDKSHSLGDKD